MAAANSINLEPFIGQDPDAARRQLEAAGVFVAPTPEVVPAPLALLYQVQLQLQAWPGSEVVMVVAGNRVVGFRVEPGAAIPQLVAEIRQLERRSTGSGGAGPQQG